MRSAISFCFTTSDNDRPPAPGEEAAPYACLSPINVPDLQAQIARLGSPSISTLLPLPLNPQGPSASFGLDFANDFARISGRNNPGTYLIGVRAVDQPGTRNWMRVQVTDLSTTIIEHERAVHPAAQTLCHLFTERPIYRPADPVHIKTDIRNLYNGLLTPDGLTQHVQLTITGPDPSINWQYGLAPDANGDADFLFNAPTTATGTTVGFDAIGGGPLAGQILSCMEAAINRTSTSYNRYGSNVHKQVYIYGNLDLRPTEYTRSFGMAYGISGWLLFPYLATIGDADTQKLRDRVAAELRTTFASHYAAEISLPEALSLANIALYNKRATGEKYLINPSRSL